MNPPRVTTDGTPSPHPGTHGQGHPGPGIPDQGHPGPGIPDQGLSGHGAPDQGLPGHGAPGQGHRSPIATDQATPGPGTGTRQRVHRFLETHPAGYRVSAQRIGPAWRFSAWGPEDRPELTYWQWLSQTPRTVHYGPGEAPPVRRPYLGTFDTAAAARAACARHAQGTMT